ncbi:META domain-containing protein [Thioclava sp. 15-R06ZXC-3]|uniref:META domain-containing protein n=1 Tax=Thioclava arctica TaxID=3238301 RepID=A0ABV3TF08_9RHOB
MRAIMIGSVLALAVLAACKPQESDPLEALAPNVIWEVTEIAGQPVPANVEVTLTHPEKGLIAGNSGCNRYNGRISNQGGRVRVGELVGTRMACPADVMAVEGAFHSNIARVDEVKIEDDRLQLMVDGKPVIIAKR